MKIFLQVVFLILFIIFGTIRYISWWHVHQAWSVSVPCGDKILIINEIDTDWIDHTYQNYYLSERNGWFSKIVRIGEINNFFPFNFARLSDVHYVIFNKGKPVWGQIVFCIDPAKVTEQEFEEIGQSLAQNFNRIPSFNLQGIVYGTVGYLTGDASGSPVHFDCSKIDPFKRYIAVQPDDEFKASIVARVKGASGGGWGGYEIVFDKDRNLPPKLADEDNLGVINPLFKLFGKNIDKCVNAQGQNIFDYYGLKNYQ